MSINEPARTTSFRPWALVALTIGLCGAIVAVLLGQRPSPGMPATQTVVEPAPPAGPTVPSPTLPEAVIEVPPPQAPGLAAFLDPEAETRLPADFEALVPTVTEPEEVEAVVALLRNRDEAANLRNEAINLLRRSQHPRLVAELVAILDDDEESERFRGFAAQHLGISLHEGDRDAAVISERLRSALSDHHLDVRRESLRALERASDPEVVGLLARGLDPAAPDDVRDLVIRAAHRADRRDLAPDIRPYLASTDPVVRIAAIYVLGRWRDETSRPALVTALRDKDPRVSGAAELALANLGPATP